MRFQLSIKITVSVSCFLCTGIEFRDARMVMTKPRLARVMGMEKQWVLLLEKCSKHWDSGSWVNTVVWVCWTRWKA